MLVESDWQKRPVALPKNGNNLKFKKGDTGNGFEISGEFKPEYDGDADKIREWYEQALRENYRMLSFVVDSDAP